MNNNYNYIDNENLYTYPNSKVLKNIPAIDDLEKLHLTEHLFVSNRIAELAENPILVNSMDSIKDIHKYLFQDMYTWAGEYRKVNISKQGYPFMAFQSFPQGQQYINGLIQEFLSGNLSKIEISKQLATILDDLNHMHPFREGNGRGQREAIRCLALEKGYVLELNPADKEQVYKAYMDGVIHSHLELLEKVIFENLAPL
ncbi:cell filamentation protein [Enterococcus sp. DIV0840]|uniref:Fic/DOC family protein n=1 Tax=Enterococcus TaxID=1350 RepID=UPI001A90CBA1|nr:MULTISPECIES: Fic family protein [Enterococcus]MBO0435561.1 Fic family protein [Enterococcus sp. DIV0849a]MBO0472145.1 Fic family protein [Enterococcus ureasiticus]